MIYLLLLLFVLSGALAFIIENLVWIFAMIFFVFIIQLLVILMKELEGGIETEWKKLLTNTYNVIVFKVYLKCFLIILFGSAFFHYLFRLIHIPHPTM